ncbi:DUF1752-domain-containing protein [Wilcoxina mikolae CBS 423.85]|nr:DUF1752-domain-containing protein [Wilcoxina mikolae CBS 423.85]
MPSRLNSPIIAVDMNRVAGVDPSNVDNLFSMWTIFSKCAESLENGRRLENLSWRLWNRETFCCDHQAPIAAQEPISIKKSKRQESDTYADLPQLSSSVDSAPSEDELPVQRSDAVGIEGKRPCIIRSNSSSDRYRGKEKHMTPVNLAKIMEDIDRNKSAAEEWKSQRDQMQRKAASMPTERVPAAMAALSKSAEEGSEPRSTHSVVRGFSPSRISSSYRSTTNIAASTTPSPVKPAPVPSQKRKPVFFIGSSSSSDDNLDDSYHAFRNSKHSSGDKRTSFRPEVSTRHLYDDDSSDDDAVSESAIDDDDLEEWESSSESGHSSYDDSTMFKRVESRPELLASRRSLLSTMLHEPQRAAQLQAAASRSTPALRRTNSPREPPLNMSIKEENEFPGSKPIRRNNTAQPLALSPRTTRRNMLATELTESLRKHLLWERQQRNTTASAHLKRRHTAADVTKLVEYPHPRGKGYTSKNNSWNNPFDEGQYEYHAAGW